MDYEQQLQKSVKLQNEFYPLVKKLMQPALAALGVNYFWYTRLLEGQFHISIGIQAPLVKLYRERHTEDLFFRNQQILAQKQTTVIWDLHKPAALTDDMLDQIGLKHGVCVFRRRKHYVDTWYIASSQENSNLYQLYLDNSAAIYRLIGYFQEKVVPQLPMKNKDFLLPYMDGSTLKLPPLAGKDEKSKMTDFYDATKLKKFTLHRGNEEFHLTLREIQCVHRLALGETSKEIAQALQLSYRTVEYYLGEIRNKTGCRDRSELVNLYRMNDLSLWFEQ